MVIDTDWKIQDRDLLFSLWEKNLLCVVEGSRFVPVNEEQLTMVQTLNNWMDGQGEVAMPTNTAVRAVILGLPEKAISAKDLVMVKKLREAVGECPLKHMRGRLEEECQKWLTLRARVILERKYLTG